MVTPVNVIYETIFKMYETLAGSVYSDTSDGLHHQTDLQFISKKQRSNLL